MTTTLVLPQSIADEIETVAREPLESAGVLVAKLAQASETEVRLLGLRILWVSPTSYLERRDVSLSIVSEGYVPALGYAEARGAVAIWLHTHPGLDASPRPSPHDGIVDEQISDLFKIRTGADCYGTLIFSPREWGFTFTGSFSSGDSSPKSIDRLWSVGDRFRLTSAFDTGADDPRPIFDRQVRAFGPAIQVALSDLRVGIIGCGGTGSAVGEQLVRLGVRHFTLLDPDTLSDTNVTRVYGSACSDVGELKVKILGNHLRRIASDVKCEQVASMVTNEAAARKLTACDVLFGCTDDNAGRLVLSRMATYFLTPLIDCGVLLSSDEAGQLTGIHGRVTTVVPGNACLVCRDRIDLARAAAELRSPGERVRLENEGYAPALGRTEPAVVTFTTAVASTAVSELLERLIGYGPEPRPTEVLLRLHDREISTNVAYARPGHYCDPSVEKLGLGFTQPFLDQTWPA
jgi:molybdopterin/thiamine biosynthesis adenylyltransferase